MSKKYPMLLIVACILLTVLPRVAVAQEWTDPVTGETDPIWMTSTLTANGDGMTATAECKTSAQNPLSPFNVTENATTNYLGLGTVCTVYPVGYPQYPVWSSTDMSYINSEGETVTLQGQCSTGNFPAVGSGDLGGWPWSQSESR